MANLGREKTIFSALSVMRGGGGAGRCPVYGPGIAARPRSKEKGGTAGRAATLKCVPAGRSAQFTDVEIVIAAPVSMEAPIYAIRNGQWKK